MKLQDLTDYERLKKMTEKELEEAARSDPDVPHLSEEDLKKFQRVVRNMSLKNAEIHGEKIRDKTVWIKAYKKP